jgi:hypothetical protein
VYNLVRLIFTGGYSSRLVVSLLPRLSNINSSFLQCCGSGSGMNNPDHISESLENNFLGLKVDGNEKVGGSGMCQTVPMCHGPQRSMFFSLSILLSSLILCISVSAPVKQNGQCPTE